MWPEASSLTSEVQFSSSEHKDNYKCFIYFEGLLTGFSKHGFTKEVLPWVLPASPWKNDVLSQFPQTWVGDQLPECVGL